MTTIECKEVCMSFGDQIVLDHISMRFENGHIYGITGRNGSGKTVLPQTDLRLNDTHVRYDFNERKACWSIGHYACGDWRFD